MKSKVPPSIPQSLGHPASATSLFRHATGILAYKASMLHRQIVAGAAPERALLFLHGILGQGQNWRSIAQRFVDARPDYAAVLVDLRAHGDSLGAAPPDTLASCASDLEELELPLPIRAVLGHSFGGKVALTFAASNPCATFIVDSAPGPRPNQEGSESVMQVLEALRRASPDFADRRSFVRELNETHRVPRATAMWLAMNLRKESGRMVFALDLRRIDALLEDYFHKDTWSAVGTETVFIRGGASPIVDAADVEQAESAGAAVVTIEGAGHWVHVDAPDALTKVLIDLVPR